jgi:hypothetical protein
MNVPVQGKSKWKQAQLIDAYRLRIKTFLVSKRCLPLVSRVEELKVGAAHYR